MTQLNLFDGPPAVGIQYGVVDRLTGEVVELRTQRGEADRWCDDANARFGRIPARATDVRPTRCSCPETLRGELRYAVEEFAEDGK